MLDHDPMIIYLYLIYILSHLYLIYVYIYIHISIYIYIFIYIFIIQKVNGSPSISHIFPINHQFTRGLLPLLS